MDWGNMVGDGEAMNKMMVMKMAMISPPRMPETSSRLALTKKNRGGDSSLTRTKTRSIFLGFSRREENYKPKGDPRGGPHLPGALVAWLGGRAHQEGTPAPGGPPPGALLAPGVL